MDNDFLIPQSGGVHGMSYQKFGFEPVFVERVKQKMKNPETKERIKMILQGVTKYDLQDRTKVRRFVGMLGKALGEKLTEPQIEHMINFVITQRIDPNNTFHLIKLWGMFR
jgi:uncharacterized protein YpuA (DUF1002 family)